MASTYTLISSNVLSSSAASVTFSAIPSTYTDLVVRFSSRAETDTSASAMVMLLNGTTSGYSITNLRAANGTTAQSTQASSAVSLTNFYNEPNDYTASTFNNYEIYIPSYTVAQNKQLSITGVLENNAAATNYSPLAGAGLWQNTAAITTILLRSASGNLASGSSFYLYGIKNS
jgi:hypothetical protein